MEENQDKVMELNIEQIQGNQVRSPGYFPVSADKNNSLQFQFDLDQQQLQMGQKQNISKSNSKFDSSVQKVIKTETGIKQNEIVFTEQSFPQNIKSSIEDPGERTRDKIISRMEYFLQQLKLQLINERHKKDFLNEAVFFIEVTIYNLRGQGEQTYRIRRIFQDFKNLDKNLQKELSLKKIEVQFQEFPFPREPKNLFDKEVFIKIGQYLSQLASKAKIVDTDTFWQFFEISQNFYQGVVKVKETFIKKRSGGRFKKQCLTSCHTWQVRYLAITSEGLMYSKGNRGELSKIREILMFDYNFNLDYGKVQTGKEQGIVITTSTRRIFIECYSQFHFYDVLAAFKEAISLSPYIEIHRFDSFAPERKDAECKWFIDGNDYFKDLYHNLINAKSSVYITDWWLSPENYLLRPVGEVKNQESRLDRVLKQLAENGVNILIILYKEVSIAMTLDSQYTKHYLKSIHPNIVIMRHPDTLLPFVWSHHEKMVVIDQQIGYLGGLDLCYGRYDTQDHKLEDLPLQQNGETLVYFPGIDYSNARVKDFENVKNHTVSNIDRFKQIRMPWHDVHMKVIGEPVKDLVRHFIQYWNFSKLDMYSKDKSKINQIIPEKEKKQEEEKGFKPQIQRMKTRIQTTFNKLKKKVKNKIQRYDSQDKINNQQLQNESMKGKQIQSRFLQFLNELKKNPDQTENSPSLVNQEELKAFKGNVQQQNIKVDEEIQQFNQSKLQGLGQLDYSKYTTNVMGGETVISPRMIKKNTISKQIEQSEIIMDNTDQFEKKMQQIKRTQTNIAFKIDQISEVDSIESKSKPNQTDNNKFSNFKNMNKKSSLSYQNLDDVLTDRMDDIEEFQGGEVINPIDRYKNKLTHQSILKNDNDLSQNNEKKKKESKTLKKIFSGKRKLTNPIKALANGINLLEKINLQTAEEQDINFFQFNEENKDKLQVSEILDKVDSLPVSTINNPVKSTSLWKSKVQDKVLHKKDFTTQLSNINDQEQIERSKINLNFINYQTTGTCKCQMLRSGSSWSLGLKPENTEMSIQIAYIQLIAQAHHYIYIENQFFISCTAGNVVKNQIAQALIDRIIAADKKGEDFYVCVVMPLLPGFAGEVNDSNSAVMKCQLHWEYFTISRGGNSIYEVLKQNVSDPFKYIRFYGLRTHGVLNNQPSTEIIYVHSKLMIVDDRFVIIGSANINDRSMCGTRDSEIAMIVEDTKKVPSKMNGKFVMLSEFAHTFRKALYQEHFGLTEEEADDPLNKQILQLIHQRVKTNTEIYREVFRCYPDDQVTQINQLESWQKEKKIENYDKQKRQIIGNAVEFPIDFLKNEKLNFTIRQKEYYVPVQSFLQTTWKVIQNSFRFFIC